MELMGKMLSRFLPNKINKKLLYHKKYQQLKNSTLDTYLQKNKQFKAVYQGKRCFVLGNGPSLNKMDFSILKDEITFTVNDLFYHKDFDKLNTSFHVFADPFYFNEPVEILNKLFLHSNPSGVFMEGSGLAAVIKTELHKEYPIFFYANGLEVEDLLFEPIDLCKFLPYFCTVVQSAVMLAVYMGFSEIYLLGCDCTGILNYIDRVQDHKIKHYAYQLPTEEIEKHKKISISSEHMFYEWYHIFKSYRLLREVLKQKGVRIINLSEDGILDSLEKGKLKDVIQSK